MRTIHEIKEEIMSIGDQLDPKIHKLWHELYENITDEIPLEQLLQICDAVRANKCFITPCKIGDIVWLADFDGVFSSIAKQGIHPLTVCFFRISENRIIIISETMGESWFEFSLLQFGQSVFLTRGEAEAALKNRI